jgi:hypothetical protein
LLTTFLCSSIKINPSISSPLASAYESDFYLKQNMHHLCCAQESHTKFKPCLPIDLSFCLTQGYKTTVPPHINVQKLLDFVAVVD